MTATDPRRLPDVPDPGHDRPTRPRMSGPRTLDEQMLADWAAVGLRRLEAHLARHAAFCDFLRDRPPDADEREDPCPPERVG